MGFIKVEEDGFIQNRMGRFRWLDIIGREYGFRLTSVDGRRYVHVLQPTPELWTLVLPHRTQILYMPDIALIGEMLRLRPGSVVIESGTGSGSFSHSIVRSIAPNGHLYTFEFHPQRAQKACDEFKDHGLDKIVTSTHRDVIKHGFGLGKVAHSVFLDLPAPWDAIEHAKAVMLCDEPAKICCFSPCIEQVQKTCGALYDHGFLEIKVFECLGRQHRIRKIDLIEFPNLCNNNGDITPRSKRPYPAVDVKADASFYASRPQHEDRGHTSYLTFATLLPTI